MRKILIFLLLTVCFASCNDADRLSGSPAGNPLTECVLPASAPVGGEVLVQWNGFSEDSEISLVAEDGASYEVEVTVVTASGIVFRVPVFLAPGTYMVVSDSEELGTIEITPADMPVTALKVPSGAMQGEIAELEGIGFEEGCTVVLVDAEGNEYTLETQLTYSGVSALVSEDVPEGEYEVYLVQDGARWLLANSFMVYKDLVVKIMTRVDYYSTYISNMMIRLSWEISREEPVTLTVSEYVIDGEEESLEAYDRYVCGADGYFELEHDGFEASNDMGMSFVRGEDGRVTQADVLVYGDSETTPFTWTYDPDGFLTDISSPKRSLRSFGYEDGNMTVFRNTMFEFSDPDLVNHPSAPDVIWGYMALMEKNDPFIYFPYLLGWYTKASSQLPTAMLSPSPTGTGTDTYPLTYEFDSDGYVTRMLWNSDYVVYHYESD